MVRSHRFRRRGQIRRNPTRIEVAGCNYFAIHENLVHGLPAVIHFIGRELCYRPSAVCRTARTTWRRPRSSAAVNCSEKLLALLSICFRAFWTSGSSGNRCGIVSYSGLADRKLPHLHIGIGDRQDVMTRPDRGPAWVGFFQDFQRLIVTWLRLGDDFKHLDRLRQLRLLLHVIVKVVPAIFRLCVKISPS